MSFPRSASLRRHAWFLSMAFLAVWSAEVRAQPSTRYLHSAFYDPPRQRMILFGGTPESQFFENDTWELALGADPAWRRLMPPGPLPSGRVGQAALYDPVGDRMIVFGGYTGTELLDDVWAFSLSETTWSKLQPSGTPPLSRRYHSAIYDPVRGRLVVFGGDRGFGAWLNDAWSLWLGPSPRWEPIVPGGTPPSIRYGHTAVYDPLRDRMLVFGGNNLLGDLWSLSFANTAWTLLATAGSAPASRYAHSAIHDPVADRLVVFGGTDGLQYLDDTWMLSLSVAMPTWSRLPAGSPWPSVRGFHSAVHDSAYRRMVVFGGTPGVSEPTWALSLGAPARWHPERPVIEVSPPALNLPTVTIGDTVAVPFTVMNGGLEPLEIEAFLLSLPELRVGPDPPALPWNAASSETLWLAATTPGLAQDSLVVVSNDPLAPRRQVPLRLDVRGLEFEARVFGEPDSVAPGNSFIVVVTPEPGVTVEGGMLYYRVAGGSSPFDSLALDPLATDFIATVPASAVTERGVEYYARVENSPFTATLPAAAPATFFTQDVSSPAAITAVVPRPTSGPDFLVGQEIDVDVVLPDGTVFHSGWLHYRQGGEQGTSSLPLAPTGTPGQVSATIPDSLVGPRGVEYWVEVATLRSMLRHPAAGAAAIRTKVPDLVEPSVHAGRRYRLLGVPLDFGPDFGGSLDALLADQLGTYDPTRWRAYWYDPASEGNVEFSAAEAARFRPQPGRAFWLVTRDAHRVDTSPVAGYSTPTHADYPIALAPGWNLFANPFEFPVAWADVIRDPGVEDPVAFDPARGQIGDYADASPALLEPFQGYFIHASQAATLRIPPRAAPAAPLQAPAVAGSGGRPATADPGDVWRVRVAARTELAADGSSALGLRSGAVAGFDPLDLRKPPPAPGSWVRVAFSHPDWGERSGDYRLDLRAPGSEGETWEIEVWSSAAGEAVSLDLSEVVAVPAEVVLSLIDREQGVVTRWQPASGPAQNPARPALQHRIVSFGPGRSYRLAVAAGTEAYVARAENQGAVVPRGTLLDPAAPNPFRLATRVRFALDRAGPVRLEVYSVLGERVATLVERTLEPGYHTSVWDGRTFQGGPAPSGVYLLRLRVDGHALTRRVVLVR